MDLIIYIYIGTQQQKSSSTEIGATDLEMARHVSMLLKPTCVLKQIQFQGCTYSKLKLFFRRISLFTVSRFKQLHDETIHCQVGL